MKMMVNISVRKAEEIEGIWPSIINFLEPAIEQDFVNDEESLKNLLMQDKALLFIATVDGNLTGAAITQIEKFKKCDIVNILSLGGKEFKHWKTQMNDALTQYAFYMECKYIVANGVRAWQRLWPDFKPGNVCYTKEIF